MAESKTHKGAKTKAAGKGGQTEVPLSRGRRLDAITAGGDRATEIERSGAPAQLEKAVRRLKSSEAPKKVLKVPQSDMDAAAAALRAAGVSGTVENSGGTKSRKVRASKK
ncbi:MAG: hypothetical protein A2139_08650 [Desulfobacca sp. RBG_16_60_12]|nr:MAG: hypothetical protein A2139_08650 [Desulfobacca sp. RBG_16_60_12]